MYHFKPLAAVAAGLVLSMTAFVSDAAEWPTAAPSDAGFAGDLAAKLDAAISEEDMAGLHGVVLVRDGKLVYEKYLTGDDEVWGRRKSGVVFGPDMLHDLRSITKSVVGLLYGIALADGVVPPPEASLLSVFPEHADLAADPDRNAITLHHVLSMTTGMEWNEDAPYGEAENSETAMNRAPDSIRYALEQPMVAEPGSDWTYSGGATTLLAEVIERGSGTDLVSFARDRLFEPLGITDFAWTADYYGVPYAHSGLRLRPRDAAKIGQLVLQNGQWNGQQVVPSDWIAAATSVQTSAEFGCDYGYHWWLCRTEEGLPVIEGAGYGGQQLLILPELDVVLMVNAGLYGDPDAWLRAYGLLERVVIPAVSGAAN